MTLIQTIKTVMVGIFISAVVIVAYFVVVVQTETEVAKDRPFITTWKTDNEGPGADDQIEISTSGSGYNYQIDWGDGNFDSNVSGDIIHTYVIPGIYTISISGDFPSFIPSCPDSSKFLSVEQWGTIHWQSMHATFHQCGNFVINAVDTPNLSQVSSMREMFLLASNFNQDLSTWDVSSVTDMTGMFKGAQNFNQDLSSWDVSSVTNMKDLFYNAENFNQNLNSWDVSSVTDMTGMFRGAQNFNQDLSSWDVSSVTDVTRMFKGAQNFNQDLSSWDVSSVTNMKDLFHNAENFNQNLNSWDVSSVISMSTVFDGARNFNQDLSSWNVSSVNIMHFMFTGASNFNQDLSSWDVSSVTTMQNMFHNAENFNQDLSSWDVSSVTNMRWMLSGTNLSTENYDALLLNWSKNGLQKFVSLSTYAQYSKKAQGARDILTEKYHWKIDDGGVAPD